jgi:hypothetical protein
MKRTVKIFCSGKDQKDLLAQKELKGKIKVVDQYKAFLLVEVPKPTLEKIAQIYPNYQTEDITDHYTLQVGERTVDTSIPRFEFRKKVHAHPAYKGIKQPGPGRHHYLVQFKGPIKEDWLKRIKTAGSEPREPFGDFTYIVRADESTLEKVKALPFVRWVGHLPHEDRIAPAVLKNVDRKTENIKKVDLPRTKVIPGTYMVEFFGPQDVTKAVLSLMKSGIKILGADPEGKVMAVEITGTAESIRRKITRLSSIHGVRYIRERSLKRSSNDVASQIMGTASSMATGARGSIGLSGVGEYIGVCDTGLDTGDPDTLHRDFSKRLYSIKSYPITRDFDEDVKNPGGDDGPADLDSGHGTHVAGSALGDGAASAGLPGLTSPIRGLAYRAKLVFQAVE